MKISINEHYKQFHSDNSKHFSEINKTYFLDPDYVESLSVLMPQHKVHILCFEVNSNRYYIVGTLHQNEFKFYNEKAVLITNEQELDDEIMNKILIYCSENFSSYSIQFPIELMKAEHSFQTFDQNVSYINLNNEQESITKDIRRSYRSLINWGKKNLRLDLIDSSNTLQYSNFIEFYHSVSGQTKSHEFWNSYLNLIKANKAFLYLGYHNEIMVSSVFVVHSQFEAFYALGAYDRDLMNNQNFPLAHWPLVQSILHSKELGLKQYIVGKCDQIELSPKEKNIYYFKTGFTSDLRILKVFTKP